MSRGTLPITQYIIFPKPIIPSFHYSPRCFSGDERSELSSNVGILENWVLKKWETGSLAKFSFFKM